MTPTDTNQHELKGRTERIDLRVDAELKALFVRAAQLSGSNLSAFVIDTVRARAQRLVEEHERFVLSNRARDRFLDVLGKPPAPNAALRRAARKHAAK